MWEEGVHIYGTPGVPNNFPLIGGNIIIYGIDKITHTNKFYFSHENDNNTKKPLKDLKTSKMTKIPFEPPKWLKCTTNVQNIPKPLKWLKCP